MSVDALYQEVILDHNKNPRNYGSIEGNAAAVHQENPSCGDQIDLQLLIDDGCIKDVKFTSYGCAISRASASMMTDAIMGKSVDEVFAIIESFRMMIIHEAELPEALAELESLSGVRKFPTRVKCAMLAWSALEKLLPTHE